MRELPLRMGGDAEKQTWMPKCIMGGGGGKGGGVWLSEI